MGLAVAHADGDPVTVEHVGAVAMSAAGVDGAAAAVVLSDLPRETVYVSDRVAAEVEELMLTLGEGPGVDALTDGPAFVAVQIGVTAAVALARLRAHAYAHDRRLREVASDVVGRRLRFEPEAGAPGR